MGTNVRLKIQSRGLKTQKTLQIKVLIHLKFFFNGLINRYYRITDICIDTHCKKKKAEKTKNEPKYITKIKRRKNMLRKITDLYFLVTQNKFVQRKINMQMLEILCTNICF